MATSSVPAHNNGKPGTRFMQAKPSCISTALSPTPTPSAAGVQFQNVQAVGRLCLTPDKHDRLPCTQPSRAVKSCLANPCITQTVLEEQESLAGQAKRCSSEGGQLDSTSSCSSEGGTAGQLQRLCLWHGRQLASRVAGACLNVCRASILQTMHVVVIPSSRGLNHKCVVPTVALSGPEAHLHTSLRQRLETVSASPSQACNAGNSPQASQQCACCTLMMRATVASAAHSRFYCWCTVGVRSQHCWRSAHTPCTWVWVSVICTLLLLLFVVVQLKMHALWLVVVVGCWCVCGSRAVPP